MADAPPNATTVAVNPQGGMTITPPTAGTGDGGAKTWSSSIDGAARGLIAMALVGTLCVGFLKGLVSGDAFIGIVAAALGWYGATRPGNPTVVTTTAPRNGG